jgi:protein-tyrosine phosphatase
MYKISANIYQGAQPVSWAPFIQEADNWAIVSLNHSDGVGELPIINLKFPIKDGPSPGLPWLKAVVACIEQLDRINYKVLIHCTAGISRSAFVTAAFLMQRWGMSKDTALDVIGKVNNRINPAPAFMRLLSDWEEYLKSTWAKF